MKDESKEKGSAFSFCEATLIFELLNYDTIARFGYGFYEKWNAGEITQEKAVRLIEAERTRERAQWINLELIVMNAVRMNGNSAKS